MASYLPPQQRTQSWTSEPPKPGSRAPLQFPSVHSGSRRDFSGHWSGDPEFQTPTLNRTSDFLKRNVGNYLLYKGVYERGQQQIVDKEDEILHSLHPDGGGEAPGALANQPLPGAGPEPGQHEAKQPGSPKRRPAGMDPRKRGTFAQVSPEPTTNMGGLFDRTPNGGDPTGADRPAWMHSSRLPLSDKLP